MLGPKPLPEQETESIPTPADNEGCGKAIGAERRERLARAPLLGPASEAPVAGGRGRSPGNFQDFQVPAAGSCRVSWPEFHSEIQMWPLESDQTRRAPCPAVGGSSMVAAPLARSTLAMWLPASEA